MIASAVCQFVVISVNCTDLSVPTYQLTFDDTVRVVSARKNTYLLAQFVHCNNRFDWKFIWLAN